MSLEESSSSSPELGPIEETDHVAFKPSVKTERSDSFSSDSVEASNDDPSDTPTLLENRSNSEPFNSTMVVVTSPSFNFDLSSEQNDSINQLNSSSSSTFLQTQQRRINHRRNKSEPFKSISNEDLSSTTSNEIKDEIRRKSSSKIKHSTQEKTPPSSTTTTRKKKAWYNPFQSTYRQRNEEFRKTFKDLPNEERLIVDYSCAWQKDILVQGRMYLSQNYLCFYANILNWKSSLTLKFTDIDSIKREKTAKVISNAIEIKSKKGEKFFFASFVTRDKTFALMERIHKYSVIDQTMPGQQLWALIHENYGDDLDMTTDEDDNHHKPTSPSNNKYDLSNIVLRLTPNSIQSKSAQQEDDHSSVSSRGEYQTEDEEMVANEDDTNQNAENIEVVYLSECLCQKHLATELINRTYTMSVEQLFDCIFGDNDFLVAYRTSRRIKDFQAAEWQINSESGKRERVCTYKVSVTAVIGSTTICVTERQVIDCELSKSHYIIDTEVRNEGIKYADAFFVASRYCLVQIGPQKSHLKVTGEVRYVKSLMAIIKTFIEKNAMAALQDSFTDLMKRIDQESSKQSRSTNNNNEKQTVIQTKTVIHRQSIQSNDLSSSINDLSVNSQQDEGEEEELTQKHSNIVLKHPKYSTRNTFFVPFCIITMLFLIIVNMFLCIKLNQIDQMTDRLIQNYPSWLNRYSIEQDDNQWSSLLKKQEEYYQTQLNSLQNVLITTHNALKNVTNALNQLSQLSSGSS